jgi:hypothetical protein
MLGLFLSQAILLVAAALIGFGVGWRLYVLASAGRRREQEQDIEQLRHGLSDAQVRRARLS